MGWVESLQRAIDYMEEHIEEPLSIEEIAKQASSSVFHFQRTFTILTDCSVAEYLRRRRLTLAAHELSGTDRKVIEIALKYGYDTPEAFSKAFRRQHGVTPSEARKHLGELQSFNRLVIQVNLKGVLPMKFRIVEKESFQAVGIKRDFSMRDCENMRGISEMWVEVNTDGTSGSIAQLNDGGIDGLLGICTDFQNGSTMEYWIAAESTQHVPEGFGQLEVPASKWGVFEVRGSMPDAIQKVWKQIYSEWFPSNPYENAGTAEMEVYPAGNPYSDDYVSEIWIPLKAKK